MTGIDVQGSQGRMAPKQFIGENLNLLLPKGTKDRIKAALNPGEKSLGFIREAIELHLKRRERTKRREGEG